MGEGGGTSCSKLWRCVWWRGTYNTDFLPSYMWNTSMDQWAFCVCVFVCVCVQREGEGVREGKLDHIKCHSLLGTCSKTTDSKQALWLHAEYVTQATSLTARTADQGVCLIH